MATKTINKFTYEGNTYQLKDDVSGYITSAEETDPVFSASAASGITSADITNWNSKTSNTGTVTSVRVQATAPVQSSTSTAQTSTLNTTISLADGYGDTKNPYASKTKNYVLAAPSSANGVPSFRKLVGDDLPIATASTLGGIKVGSGLNIDSSTGVLSATGTSLTIDTAISTTSTNPVQNQAIGNALANKVESTSQGTGITAQIENSNGSLNFYANQGQNSYSSLDVHSSGVGLTSVDGSDVNELVVTPTSTTITNVVNPTNDTDAANKQYVDNSIPSNTSIETTGISIANHSTTSIYGVGSSTTTASKASGANSTVPSLTFAMDSTTTTQLNITWSAGSASTWSFSDITVPIKNSSSTTVVTSATHSVTDNGHNHDVGNYL